MKRPLKRISLSIIPFVLLLVGCAGPLGKMGRVWPDGASVVMRGVNLTVSMTGAGSLTVQELSWTGTNGFPVPGTNSISIK